MTDKLTDEARAAFDRWFFGSKYAQVVTPTAGDEQRALDAWTAGQQFERARIARLLHWRCLRVPTVCIPSD